MTDAVTRTAQARLHALAGPPYHASNASHASHASNAALWRERLGAEVLLVPGARHFNVSEASAVLATLRSL